MNTCIIFILFVLVLLGTVLSGITLALLWYRGQLRLLTAIPLFRRRKRRATLSYTEDVRRTLDVLKQLQALIGRNAAEQDPRLTDIMQLLKKMQRTFGYTASLEVVIQALVAQDIKRQLVPRKRKHTTLTTSNSVVAMSEDQTREREAHKVISSLDV